jgi:hypothetical protein
MSRLLKLRGADGAEIDTRDSKGNQRPVDLQLGANLTPTVVDNGATATVLVRADALLGSEIQNITGTAALLDGVGIVHGNNVSEVTTINLPDPTLNKGRRFTVILRATAAYRHLILHRYGSETINDVTSDRTVNGAELCVISVYCDGTNWYASGAPYA